MINDDANAKKTDNKKMTSLSDLEDNDGANMKETDGKMMTAWCDQTTSSVFFYIISFNWRIMRREKKLWWFFGILEIIMSMGKDLLLIHYFTCWPSLSVAHDLPEEKSSFEDFYN